VIKLSVASPVAAASTGLKDGGRVVLACRNCKAGLFQFWVTRPGEIDPHTNEPFEWKIQANCPFCGDRSFVKTVKGNGHAGGYHVPKPGCEADEVIPSTSWTGEFESRGDVVFYKVVKASPDAHPQRIP
jgi:hypothetical protein